MSADGRYMVATLYLDYVYVSSDFGKTWRKIKGTHNYRSYACVRISRDGKYMSACIGLVGVFVSSDYGNTWKRVLSVGKDWMGFAMSSNGRYLVAKSSASYGVVVVSSDYGNTWKEIAGTWFCTELEMSRNGKYILAYSVVNYSGKVFLSSDYGNTWKEILIGAVKDVRDCAVSADGRYMTIVLGRYNEFCYISSDYGVTWQGSSLGAQTGTYRIAMNI